MNISVRTLFMDHHPESSEQLELDGREVDRDLGEDGVQQPAVQHAPLVAIWRGKVVKVSSGMLLCWFKKKKNSEYIRSFYSLFCKTIGGQ